jgi:hypothetical protein
MQLGIYKHYKGKEYLVIGIARHSETQEFYVVYIPLYDILDNQGVQMAIRPLEMFNGYVWDSGGNKYKRFEYIDKEPLTKRELNERAGEKLK